MQNGKPRSVLIVSCLVYKTPPDGYGGIERVGAMAYEAYKAHGYNVDIVSRHDSPYHTYSIQEVTTDILNKHDFVICYTYEQTTLELLNQAKVPAYVILENTFKPKLGFLISLSHLKYYVLSKHAQVQYENGLGVRFEIIPNGVNTTTFIDLGKTRQNSIAYIGAVGQHKSPLACLRYAKKNDLVINIYGLPMFKDVEEEYEREFLKEIEGYSKAFLKGEVNDAEKIKILNENDYFIFLPGVDKPIWVEPFGIAPLEAMSCGCTVITQFDKGGHVDFCKPGVNSISYTEIPRILDRINVRKSVLEYDFEEIWQRYYPK